MVLKQESRATRRKWSKFWAKEINLNETVSPKLTSLCLARICASASSPRSVASLRNVWRCGWWTHLTETQCFWTRLWGREAQRKTVWLLECYAHELLSKSTWSSKPTILCSIRHWRVTSTALGSPSWSPKLRYSIFCVPPQVLIWATKCVLHEVIWIFLKFKLYVYGRIRANGHFGRALKRRVRSHRRGYLLSLRYPLQSSIILQFENMLSNTHGDVFHTPLMQFEKSCWILVTELMMQLLLALARGSRPENTAVDRHIALSDAHHLNKVCTGKIGNEEMLIRIFTTRSSYQLSATMNYYQQHYGHDFEKVSPFLHYIFHLKISS